MPRWKERNAPKVGKTFVKIYKDNTYTLKVVSSSIGVAYSLHGQTFNTPTAAAKFITKHEVNGWAFWGIST
jgi:hypothetical protein